MSLGFAIVGTGMISEFHVRALAEVRGAKFVACYDRAAKRAKQFGKEHGCTAYNSLDELFQDERVDAVTIATASGAWRGTWALG